MADQGTSVTLIFYRVGAQWWKEPALNLLAAGFQLSPYTHVELSIGEEAGAHGMMSNVARVFNGASLALFPHTLPFLSSARVFPQMPSESN